MERAAFVLLRSLEGSWWYRGRALIARNVLSQHVGSGKRILDYGAGYGGMYPALSRFGSVSAYEPDEEARATLPARGYMQTFAGEEEALAKTYDCIGLFDVLEHIEDDEAFLKKAYAALAPGGALVVTVPAMPFLWSVHDETHKHFRRYTRRMLQERLARNGFKVAYISFWNMTLFLPAALVRLMGISGETSFRVHPAINAILYAIVWCEAQLMRLIPLPFGISLVAVARKP